MSIKASPVLGGIKYRLAKIGAPTTGGQRILRSGFGSVPFIFEKMNITQKNLFPGIDGFAESLANPWFLTQDPTNPIRETPTGEVLADEYQNECYGNRSRVYHKPRCEEGVKLLTKITWNQVDW